MANEKAVSATARIIPVDIVSQEGRNCPLGTAYAYAEIGLAVHPLCGVKHGCATPGKIPFDLRAGQHLAGWQTHGVPTSEEIGQWLRHPAAVRANIGCLTGSASGIIALDIDGDGGEQQLMTLSGGDVPATWEYRTGAGRRLIYAYDERVSTTNHLQGDHQGVEVLSDGRQMVLPPSVHPSGRQYSWEPGRDPWTFGAPAPIPEWLIEDSNQDSGSRKDLSHLLDGAPNGARNISMTQLVGKLLSHGLDIPLAWVLTTSYNQTHVYPPMAERELLATFESIVKRELTRQRRGRR